MTTLRQAAQATLEALELHATQYPHMVKGYTSDAAEALRAALAEPQPEPVASTNARTQFEHFFAESRKGKGPSRRPTFAQLQDGTYVEDSTQRHWWTWQNAAPQAQQPLREGEVMGAYVDFDRTADHAWSNAEYLTRFGLYISKHTAERTHKIGVKP